MTDPIIEAARFIKTQLEYCRHQPWADELLVDIDAATRVLRSVARGSQEQRYLGPCGAELVLDITLVVEGGGEGIRTYAERTCDGDVYAREGAERGRCRTCGAEVATQERRAWLDEQVRGWAFRASEIAAEYRINVKTIRSWATRGQLKSYWRTEAGLVTPWVELAIDETLTGDERDQRAYEIAWEIERRGSRLHYVGDVLDLAAGDAARREEARAKRARRMEQRSGEEAA